MSYASDDLASVLAPGPVELVSFGEAVVKSWDPATLQNQIEYRGGVLTNLDILASVDAFALQAGDTVWLMKWRPAGGAATYIIAGGPRSPGPGAGRLVLRGGVVEIASLDGLLVSGTGGVTVSGGGAVEVEDGAAVRAYYPSGNQAIAYGSIVVGGQPSGHGLLVRRDQEGATGSNIFRAGMNAEAGGAIVWAGSTSSGGTVFHPIADVSLLAEWSALMATEFASISHTSGDHIIGASSDAAFLVTTNTTSNSANLHVFESGSIARVTSSRRYKADIVDHAVDSAAVLRLRPRSWTDIGDHGEKPCPGIRLLAEEGPPVALKPNTKAAKPAAETPKRHVGLVAEEVHEAGLTDFVSYDAEGRPDAVAYDRLSVALLGVVKQLESRVTALEAAVKGRSAPRSGAAPGHSPAPSEAPDAT